MIEAYYEMSNNVNNSFIKNERYMFQNNSAQYIPDDVVKHLLLNKDDKFHNIGWGSGDIMMTISVFDHKNLLNSLNEHNPNKKIDYLLGKFVKAELKEIRYTNILHLCIFISPFY